MRSRNSLPPATLGGESPPTQPMYVRAPRVVWASLTVLLLVVGFVLAITFLRVTDTRAVLAYLAGMAVLTLVWVLMHRRYPLLNHYLAGERSLLGWGLMVCALAYPFFVTDPYQLHVVTMAGIFALMAVGLNVTTGFAGLADFGYIAYYAIGAYASALLNVRLGLDFWFCLPLAGLSAAAMSLLVAFPAVRVKGHYLALVTLGFASIIILLITNLQGLTGGTQGVAGIASPSVFGHRFSSPIVLAGLTLPPDSNFYYLVLFLLWLAVVVCLRVMRSHWGRAWSAMRIDEVAASAVGLNLTRLKLLAFGTGASLGGLAGSLYVHMVGFVDPSSFPYIESIFLLAIVAIGNWRLSGVIVTALIFTILPEKLRAFDEWRLLIFGAALLVVMLARGRRMKTTH